MPPRKPPKEATPSPFGLRLRAAREARGLSMRELAAAATTPDGKVSHAAISLIESGRQTAIEAATAVRLARVLGVTVEWLVTGST
jgi:transcriptional regulator with XRE-family HTH domain